MRKREWMRTAFNPEIVEAGVETFWDLGSTFTTAYGLNFLPAGSTVARTRLSLVTVNNSESSLLVTFGLILVDSNNENQVPVPLEQPHADWMWWSRFYMSGNQTRVFDAPDTSIDVRSQRKAEGLSRLYLVGDVPEEETGTVNVTVSSSSLLLLA